MGEVRHEPLIVASWNDGHLQTAHAKAVEIFSSKTPRVEVDFPDKLGDVDVTPIMEASYNSGSMFMVPSPGSKVGWAPAKDFEARVEEFIAWMVSKRDLLGQEALYLDWAWVCFGGDGHALIRHSNVHDRTETWGSPWGFVYGDPLIAEKK